MKIGLLPITFLLPITYYPMSAMGWRCFLFATYFSFTLQLYVIVSAGTPYAGGVFRMKLVLGKSFPSDPPKGFFLTKIFHPNVAKNGEICVNTLKKDWKPMLGIKHVLLVSWYLILNPYVAGG